MVLQELDFNFFLLSLDSHYNKFLITAIYEFI